MSISRVKSFFVGSMASIFLLGGSVLAGPVEVGPPAVVDGKVAPYPRVKKHGVIWYPASVVGYHRSISFAYDPATEILYANGVETHIKALMVDNTVYVNLTPKVSQGDMRPGMTGLAARRHELEAMEQTSPHFVGRTDALLMSESVPHHSHPWSQQPGERQGPLINLDPTHEEPVAAHMRPGARPPEQPPEALPNRLPRPGEAAATSSPTYERAPVVQIPPSNGFPERVTAEGGPTSTVQVSPPTATTNDPNGLQPIPEKVVETAPVDPFSNSGPLRSAFAENSVYKVHVTKGTWEAGGRDNLLRLKVLQKNQSRVAQSNLGSFAVRCADGTRVEASRTRSYLPDGTLDPGAGREGDLVFRFEGSKHPETLELEGALPLSVPILLQ